MIKHIQKDPLTLADMQAFHVELDRAKQFDLNFMLNVGYMAGEIGEAVNAYRQLTKAPDPQSQDEARAHLGEELADCLAYILKLANYTEIDLEEAYVRKMTRNISRTWRGVGIVDQNAD